MDKPVLRADARRNRAKVLAAAEEAFAVDGLAVPLDEIARIAGVGAGTVYRHFPSKEALFQAVVVDRLEQFAREARELLTAEDPGEAFFDFFKRVVRQASRNRALCDALAETTGLGFKASAGNDFRAASQALLTRAQAAGAVREDIDGDDLRALIAGCLAAERYSLEERHLVRIVVDGLRTSHSTCTLRNKT
ncbi:TetR/AcrR family transcriptional regulator [Amycolatopsis decaplanina]|uniref:TetR family transcriptional regulator n=1 Tax=Amycolatopsis decaplanina DSM 44594 TaxID=1284240 RepID=M2YZ03_9PSEU|nr:TetR/AcrR family transcriptional regulator [Amycolatopsis decaplanina]EME60162.1 TetR family transcriptional regulator [Amycolatopsis decaplanina DSM 44594]